MAKKVPATYRSSVTGHFVCKDYAKTHPYTTVRQTNKKGEKVMFKKKFVARFCFDVKYEGRVYKCYRIIRGHNVLEQTITVIGVGSKLDRVNYGERHYPISTMEAIAQTIAREILMHNKVVAKLNTLVANVAANIELGNQQLKIATKNIEINKKQLLKLQNLRSQALSLNS